MMRKKIRALLGSNTPITADFVYTNTQEVPAKDGTTWLKAEERFQWDKYCCGDENMVSPSKKFEAPSGSESYWTEPLRTVYIPVRDADGTLLNVAGYGNLYCD